MVLWMVYSRFNCVILFIRLRSKESIVMMEIKMGRKWMSFVILREVMCLLVDNWWKTLMTGERFDRFNCLFRTNATVSNKQNSFFVFIVTIIFV